MKRRLPVVADGPQPLAERIAAGLHKIGMAMKQEQW